MTRDGLRVAVVGVTGAVGTEMLRVLEKREFPVSELVPLASARSAGGSVEFAGRHWTIGEATADSFQGVDIALFSAGAARSKALAPAAVEAGAIVVDNSSAFRMHPDIPLIVPEVNAAAMSDHAKIIANPNCAAIILTVGLAPLRSLGQLRRVIVSTYQSASGAGAKAMDELVEQTRGFLAGDEPPPQVFHEPIAFNVFSHNASVEENGYNGEENKVMAETQKILGMPSLGVTVTCIRVSVLRAHCESVLVEFDRSVDPDTARRALADAPGVQVLDDRQNNRFPMPRAASGQDAVFVGRIRRDTSNPHGLWLWLAGDQLLKGAALNAVQIAEAVIARPGFGQK